MFEWFPWYMISLRKRMRPTFALAWMFIIYFNWAANMIGNELKLFFWKITTVSLGLFPGCHPCILRYFRPVVYVQYTFTSVTHYRYYLRPKKYSGNSAAYWCHIDGMDGWNFTERSFYWEASRSLVDTHFTSYSTSCMSSNGP